MSRPEGAKTVPTISVVLDGPTAKWLDQERGLVKRSTWVANVLRLIKEGKVRLPKD